MIKFDTVLLCGSRIYQAAVLR